MRVRFGDLPREAQQVLSRGLGIDYSMSDFRAPRWFSAWATSGHEITGIFAIEFKYPFDGYVSILVRDHSCMTKNVLRAIFTAAFSQAVRLTAEVEPHNRLALKQVQRMGFVYEGYKRMGLEGTRDVLQYGMLRDDCKYLPGYKGPTVIANPVIDYEYTRVH